MILTHAGKLGDFLYCLPIAAWLHRVKGWRIHWVLPNTFHPFNYLTPLLMAQPFTSRVTMVPYVIDNFMCGGQPYRFDPAQFGVEGMYVNLGFRGYPDRYVSQYYADEYGWDYEREYRINLGEPLPKTDEILRSSERHLGAWAPQATEMGKSEDLLALARRMQAAHQVHTWFCGLAILCYMSGIPVIVHRVPGHASIPLYYEGDCRHVLFIEHAQPPA